MLGGITEANQHKGNITDNILFPRVLAIFLTRDMRQYGWVGPRNTYVHT